MTGRAFWLSLSTFVIASVGDTATTMYGIGVVGLDEMNPTVATLIGSHGLLVLLPLTAVVVGGISLCSYAIARLDVPYSSVVATGLLTYGTVLKTIATVHNVTLVV